MTSLENSVSPSWVVQILFGRYRSLGDLQWSHLAVMGGVGFVMLSTLEIDKGHMGRRMYSLLIGEMVRVDTILDKGLKPQQNSQLGCGDTGWGKEGGKVEHVHFNTSIAKSYYVLEKTALSRRPGMRHRESRTIREYVAALKKAFPSLKQALCDEYIDTYERAVFGNYKCTYDEYNQFMKVVLQIVATINEKSYLQQQQELGSNNAWNSGYAKTRLRNNQYGSVYL